ESITPPGDPNTEFISELAGLIKESSGFQECDQENIQNWLECDVDDPGHQVLTDDEIIASVIDDQDLCDEDCAEKGPSSEEAFHCLETAMKWVEQQEECDAVQLLCLKRLRDLAAKKRVSIFTPILRVLFLLLRITSSLLFECRNWDKLNLRVAFKLSSDREFRDLGFAIFMRENICSYTYVAVQLAQRLQALGDVTALISRYSPVSCVTSSAKDLRCHRT
ncbi:hypothetical protein C0J52_12094, partial [Blattella germanica]